MDIAIAGQHLDLTSLISGAVIARTVEAGIIRALKPLPKLIVGLLKARVKALADAGKIDAPTMRLLASYGRATFEWADTELPDKPGPEKMAAVLDRLAAVPYLGAIVRADRAGAEQILQAAYDSVKAEAKQEASDDVPGGHPDASKTPAPGGAPAAPEEPKAPAGSDAGAAK